jgi:hypothetical protein
MSFMPDSFIIRKDKLPATLNFFAENAEPSVLWEILYQKRLWFWQLNSRFAQTANPRSMAANINYDAASQETMFVSGIVKNLKKSRQYKNQKL